MDSISLRKILAILLCATLLFDEGAQAAAIKCLTLQTYHSPAVMQEEALVNAALDFVKSLTPKQKIATISLIVAGAALLHHVVASTPPSIQDHHMLQAGIGDLLALALIRRVSMQQRSFIDEVISRLQRSPLFVIRHSNMAPLKTAFDAYMAGLDSPTGILLPPMSDLEAEDDPLWTIEGIVSEAALKRGLLRVSRPEWKAMLEIVQARIHGFNVETKEMTLNPRKLFRTEFVGIVSIRSGPGLIRLWSEGRHLKIQHRNLTTGKWDKPEKAGGRYWLATTRISVFWRDGIPRVLEIDASKIAQTTIQWYQPIRPRQREVHYRTLIRILLAAFGILLARQVFESTPMNVLTQAGGGMFLLKWLAGKGPTVSRRGFLKILGFAGAAAAVLVEAQTRQREEIKLEEAPQVREMLLELEKWIEAGAPSVRGTKKPPDEFLKGFKLLILPDRMLASLVQKDGGGAFFTYQPAINNLDTHPAPGYAIYSIKDKPNEWIIQAGKQAYHVIRITDQSGVRFTITRLDLKTVAAMLAGWLARFERNRRSQNLLGLGLLRSA